MRILVTGGAGFLGSVLVPELLGLAHHVTVLDNFAHRQNSLAHLFSRGRAFQLNAFEIINADCRDVEAVHKAAERADFVIPLAGIVGAPACAADPLAAWSINSAAVEMFSHSNLIDKKIVIPITNSGYGIGEKGKKCTEESPLNPLSVYGKSKVSAEKEVMRRGNAVSLRLATVFGMSPRMRLDLLVNDFVHRAVTDRAVVLFEPHFKRNFIHVRDVSRAFVHAIYNFDKMRDNVYNVGLSEENLSKAELCERIKAYVPGFVYLEAPVGKDPDQRDYEVDNSKIEAAGFKTLYGLDCGIRELVMGLRAIKDSVYGNA